MTLTKLAGCLASVAMMWSATAQEPPEIDAAIPEPIKTLPLPAMTSFPNGVQMAVTAITETAQAHVNHGMNHLHGGWEFEASRHFAAAMREDPECLLAHWGMVMSLLSPSPETEPTKNAATARMIHLVNQGKGTELERGYAFGLIKYIEEGSNSAALAFRDVAEKFPNEMQAAVFAALFSRSGYNDLGFATPAEEAAEKSLLALIQKHPESPLPLHALLTIRAEAPDLTESVALARLLCQMSPDYPLHLHLLGHYEWRCGEHSPAATAFNRASNILENWMKIHHVTVADCPEWVRSECYRVVALISKGDFDTAYTASRRVASTPFPNDRDTSAGVRSLMWDAKTLPARALLYRGFRGNAHEAIASLPKPEELEKTKITSHAHWWIEGLRIALETQRLIDTGQLTQATEVLATLTLHGESMSKSQAAAAAGGERSSWNRAFRALEILASDLRGRIALAGPKSEIRSAYNWFSSAADRQRPAPMMLPPLILTPMALRIGDYFTAVNRYEDAIEAYQRALKTSPNDMYCLIGLKHAYDKANLSKEAAETEKQIENLRER